MGTNWYISPIDVMLWSPENKITSDLYIDPDEYREALIKDWSFEYLGVVDRESPYNILEWRFSHPETRGVARSLSSDCQNVIFRYEEIRFFDFIFWHRQFVSEKYTLYLFNESSFPKRLTLSPKIDKTAIEDYYFRK